MAQRINSLMWTQQQQQHFIETHEILLSISPSKKIGDQSKEEIFDLSINQTHDLWIW